MISIRRNKLTLIWLLLCALTVASYLAATKLEGATYFVSAPITTGVLIAALIKSRFVMHHFMELRAAPSWLGGICDGWLVVLFGVIFVVYWSAI